MFRHPWHCTDCDALTRTERTYAAMSEAASDLAASAIAYELDDRAPDQETNTLHARGLWQSATVAAQLADVATCTMLGVR